MTEALARIKRVFTPFRPARPWPRPEAAAQTIARVSRGNALLQLGRVKGSAEYEREKKAVQSFAF